LIVELNYIQRAVNMGSFCTTWADGSRGSAASLCICTGRTSNFGLSTDHQLFISIFIIG
jgi:hypothetical protein